MWEDLLWVAVGQPVCLRSFTSLLNRPHFVLGELGSLANEPYFETLGEQTLRNCDLRLVLALFEPFLKSLIDQIVCNRVHDLLLLMSILPFPKQRECLLRRFRVQV